MTPNPLHPAKFSEPILDRLAVLLEAERRRVVGRVHDGPLVVLDPFAGVGRIHRLARPGRIQTIGIEIEEPWAACHRDTRCGDSLTMMASHAHGHATHPSGFDLFDVMATSPTYGNRYSDHHNAQDGSRRRSYTHDLGQQLQPNNSGVMPWGPKYWAFHAEAYRLMLGALRPGGLLLLNVSDFYRRKELVHATEWHRGAAMGAGFVHAGRDTIVVTDRMHGVGDASTSARAPHETILRLRRPDTEET